ncbi:hypothetical protein ACS0TY_006994 [Phlomoides rotata]
MLMTQRQMLHAQNLRFTNPKRIPKVRKSMCRIKHVLTERAIEESDSRRSAEMKRPAICLVHEGHIYSPMRWCQVADPLTYHDLLSYLGARELGATLGKSARAKGNSWQMVHDLCNMLRQLGSSSGHRGRAHWSVGELLHKVGEFSGFEVMFMSGARSSYLVGRYHCLIKWVHCPVDEKRASSLNLTGELLARGWCEFGDDARLIGKLGELIGEYEELMGELGDLRDERGELLGELRELLGELGRT